MLPNYAFERSVSRRGVTRAPCYIVRSRRAAAVNARPLNASSKDFPSESSPLFDPDSDAVSWRCDGVDCKVGRLQDSNRSLLSDHHSDPDVSRTPAPRSLVGVFSTSVDQVLRASV